MKKMIFFVIYSCLCAEEQPSNALDKEHSEKTIPFISNPEVTTQTATVQYLIGNFIVLTNGLVLQQSERAMLKSLSVGEIVELSKITDNEWRLYPLHTTCIEIGIADLNSAVIEKVITGEKRDTIIELSNGDLFIVHGDAEAVWKDHSTVLIVNTESGTYLLDFYDGSFDFVGRLGNLKPLSSNDRIVSIHKDQIRLEHTGLVKWIPSVLDVCTDWHKDDIVTLQSFNKIHSITVDPNTEVFFLNNLTKNELVIALKSPHIGDGRSSSRLP